MRSTSGGQHGLCVLTCGFSDLLAGQHSRDLVYALGGREFANGNLRRFAGGFFFYDKMVVGKRCDLSLVRHAKYLLEPSKGLQASADRLGYTPADADIDLIEDRSLSVTAGPACSL